MSSCLQYAVINSEPWIGKYTNKMELCRQCPPRRLEYIIMAEIENTSCVWSVMKENAVARIEIEYWGAASSLRIVTDGVYICTCSFWWI